MKKFHINLINKNWQYYLLLFAIALILFFAVFFLPKSSFFKTINVIVRYNNSIFLIIVTFLLFLSFNIKNNRLSNLAVAIVIFPVFAFALNGLWASMYTETNVISGVLPRRDALSYFTSSMELIERGCLVGYTSRRPLFAAFFAFLLWLFRENMLFALASLAFLSAIATFFTLIEMRKTFNVFAAIIFFIPQFFYYRLYIGNVMSETLGYILGMSAISFFLIALRRKATASRHNLLYFLCGTFFFALSQLARPGAIVTLPLLVFLAGWIFRDTKRVSWKSALTTLLVILFAYALNNFLFNNLTGKEANQFNSSFHGIYGVVMGGKSWYQLVLDTQEINPLGTGMNNKIIIKAILTELINHPNNFINGMLYQFSTIFSLKPINTYNIYSYMLANNLIVGKLLIYSYYFLSAIGIGFAVKNSKKPLIKFILVLLLGFIFSLPFAPAYQTQYMRYYSATIPLLGLLPAIGFTHLIGPILNKTKLQFYLSPVESEELSPIHNYFSFLLAFFIIIAPFLLSINSKNMNMLPKGCPDGKSEVIMSYYPGTEISVIVHGATWLPNISIGDFKFGIHNIPDMVSINSFESIPVPITLFPSINTLSKQPLYVVVDSYDLPQQKTIFRACGFIDNLGAGEHGEGVFYPQKFEEY